ncbi:hypothetical protein [Streptomyces shenzhenensis]|uniref:hypothetical protein n=1 Tax=Streptomyces shenzhenensis TaxID=943815 RepID=UPI00369EFE04
MQEMWRRGIRVLPGGDYGFAWAPHGTYARDPQHFVELLGHTPMETLLATTKLGGEIMRMPDGLGQIKPGYYADLPECAVVGVLVEGAALHVVTA